MMMCSCGGMADALDSGSSEVTLVWVQLPSTALNPQTDGLGIFCSCEDCPHGSVSAYRN